MDSNTTTCLNSLSTINTDFLRGNPNIPGIIGVAIFYAIIFTVGIIGSFWAKRQQKKAPNASKTENVMLAGRNMGTFVGLMSLTATWIGGGYINGTSETIINPKFRLAWCQGPFFYTVGIFVCGLFFTKPMRDAGYSTILDSYQRRYGRVMAALMYVPAVLGSMLWAGGILASLGASLSVIIGIGYLWAVVISAGLALIYSVMGGLYSVSYTDVVQLFCMVLGLWLAIPFAMTHNATTSILVTATYEDSWLGAPITGIPIMMFVDLALMMSLAPICSQEYYQRAFAMKTTRSAVISSLITPFVIWFCTIPPVLIGAIAASTDWNMTDYRDFGTIPVPACDYPLALPMVMRFLTPTPVAILGLGAVSAAVMSSTDSSILATSSLFTVNVYTPLRNAITETFCGKSTALVSEKESVWIMRFAMVVTGVMGTIIAISTTSIYGLSVLSGELGYVILTPQVVTAVYVPSSNSYGSFVGFWFGLFMRLAIGEPFVGLSPLIKYPFYDEQTNTQQFPYRTFCALLCFILIILVSLAARECAKRFAIIKKIDAHLFACFVEERDRNLKRHKDSLPGDTTADTGQPLTDMKSVNAVNAETLLMKEVIEDDDDK